MPAFIAAIFSASSIGLTWFWLEETHGPEKRGTDKPKSVWSFGAMFQALGKPQIGLLLVLMFAQQLAFGGFEQLLALFTLNRLGLNASGNAVIFVFVGIIVVAVQGGLVGKWSRKWGDRKLIYLGLATLVIGMALTAITPAQPPPWYSKAALTTELSSNSSIAVNQIAVTHNIPIALPSDSNLGWLGLIVLLIAMIPASIGGGILQPAINSLITKRVDKSEIGATLGLSTSFLSAANALAPIIGGTLFQLGGASLPFWVWSIVMAVLLIAAIVYIKPGVEEQKTIGAVPSEIAP